MTSLPDHQAEPFTVSELTRRIRAVLETGFPLVAITGELSNVRRHSSGHVYFTLKDERAQISAVIWRSRLIQPPPEDGLKVVISGRLVVYVPRGVYQIDVYSMRPLGVGELQRMFDELKRKLAAEGLFDSVKKKSLPAFVNRIGLVTSPTGAALRDFVNVLRRRFPALELVVAPVRVQGAGAAAEIAGAIRSLNALPGIDVVVLARGGGSLEDLWAFNEESVARAISASAIPVVSAIGHEIDFTIADFVSDLRAPTPSAAAELVVSDKQQILGNLTRNWYTLTESIREMLARRRDRIEHLLRSHSFQHPLDRLKQASQNVDDAEKALVSILGHRFRLAASVTTSLQKRIAALNPELTLKRGYSLVSRNGELVKSRKRLHDGDRISIRFHDGSVDSIVT